MDTNGNKNVSNSFMDVLLSLKSNIFRTLNVAEVCSVREINGDAVRCELLTSTGTFVETVKSVNLDIAIGDAVLVVFTTTDFRAGLNLYKNNNKNTTTSTISYHDVKYGVIVSVVYKK